MAGFEVVVRPVVFPNIRPTPKRSLPPQDDPDKGIAAIRGQPAQIVNLPFSWNISSSHSRPTETKRRVDEARIYQEEDDGTINKENFVDVEVANKIWMKEPGGGSGTPGGVGDDLPGGLGEGGREQLKEYFYAPVQEDLNIEVRKRDIIKTPRVSRSGEESEL